MAEVKIPQAQTAELFKREIFCNSNYIRLSEPPAGKLKLWLEEEGKDLYDKSNNTFTWAAKNKPHTNDTGHEHLCGILYFGHIANPTAVSTGEMFDILLGPSKACPHEELVSTLTEEIDAMYRLYTCLYQGYSSGRNASACYFTSMRKCHRDTHDPEFDSFNRHSNHAKIFGYLSAPNFPRLPQESRLSLRLVIRGVAL